MLVDIVVVVKTKITLKAETLITLIEFITDSTGPFFVLFLGNILFSIVLTIFSWFCSFSLISVFWHFKFLLFYYYIIGCFIFDKLYPKSIYIAPNFYLCTDSLISSYSFNYYLKIVH